MITTLNNLALIAAERIWADTFELFEEYETLEDEVRLDEINRIEEKAQDIQAVHPAMYIEAVNSANQKYIDALDIVNPYMSADVAKIIEYCQKFRDQVNKHDARRALSRLQYILNKADRLVGRHTYLKEQVLI